MTPRQAEILLESSQAIVEMVRACEHHGIGEGPLLAWLEAHGMPWDIARTAIDALVQTGHLSRDGHYRIRFVKELKRWPKPSKRSVAHGAASTPPLIQTPDGRSATASSPSPTTEASTTGAGTSPATPTLGCSEIAAPEPKGCGAASPSQFRDGVWSTDMASKKNVSKKPAPKTSKKGHGIKIGGETGVTEQVLDLARNVGTDPTKVPNPLKAKVEAKVVSKRRKPDVTDRAIAQADGPPPKKAKAPKPAKELKPSMLDAAAKVLAAEGELDCKAIIAEAAKRKLWESPAGKTPHATLYAALQREISRKGKEARFVQTGPGKFAIAKGARA